MFLMKINVKMFRNVDKILRKKKNLRCIKLKNGKSKLPTYLKTTDYYQRRTVHALEQNVVVPE